ncbi:GNAT family N-acetyltransferase [Sphingomonas swuensis]|uniref:GNAT family N-acetyltransferase n=1 Tax=Sphingomonas swuensis TaxID=977800 RepID=A0ABP7SQI4_9SPHN
MTLSIHIDQLSAEDVRALLDLHVAAMRGQSPADACHVMAADSLSRPEISFFALRDEGALVAIGALKELGDGNGEVKSMRVDPGRAGQGFGRELLGRLVAEARRRGYHALLLETGRNADFAAANALYDSAGFVECGSFGGYPESNFTRFLRLDL